MQYKALQGPSMISHSLQHRQEFTLDEQATLSGQHEQQEKYHDKTSVQQPSCHFELSGDAIACSGNTSLSHFS